MGRFYGSTSIVECLAWHDEQDPRRLQGSAVRSRRVQALAMLGRFDEARSALASMRVELPDRGEIALSAVYEATAELEFLAGDLATAVEAWEEVCRLREEGGQQSFLSTSAGKLARLLCVADRLEEADAWADRAAELGASDDALTQMLWRQAKATVLGRRGEHAEAERLAHKAVAVGETTDMIDAQADTYADLGEVLALAGRADEAAAAFADALERYERKENRVMAERTQARLAELQTTAAR
jgi:tetratricopeptide (TPR) repeat protein